MISIDDPAPSDPSSSKPHHQQQISHDLKVSDIDLKFADADLGDTNNPLPNFSIRDYVFGLRSKDIACNWPFSSTSLQICLKHGVKNLLPPFQSLDCLRNNSSLTECSLENRSTDKQRVSSVDEKLANDQMKPNKKIVEANPIGSKGEKEKQSRFHQELSAQTKSKENLQPTCKKPGNASVNIVTKKSRLVVKVNSVAPNSETMASKVCPVCKIFSSSSNTTLNAHIDQCLTGEGTMKWSENPKVIVKYKVKPRKMRLMTDVYKTAPRCTVEELDRRNGTSWATNSSFPAQESQFQEEDEEEEPQVTKVNHEAVANEGDVYIDTNGTKVRILSVPKISSSHNLEGRKILKGVKISQKGSKLLMSKKNNLFKKKHNKYLKLAPNARKLCSPKPKVVFHPKKCGQGEDIVMAKNCSKGERDKEIRKVVDLGISRPSWACSKRTGFSKKFNVKNAKDLVVENSDKTFSGSDLSSSQTRNEMITSLSLVKQPLNSTLEFTKEANRIDHSDDDDEDDDGDGSQHSEDDSDSDDDDYEDTPDGDNGSKGGKFSSLTRNLTFPASKYNFKRKFSSFAKSCVKSVDGPSQDSSEQQSKIDEHTSSNKKQQTRSITSKGSNEESSVGIQPVNGPELESIRPTSFMGLSSSFDPEFSNSIDLYQDQICSINRAPNDVEKQESYFQTVDPIPIPGPPGSFLPASPGGEMVSEEPTQETRVPSSENQHHHDTVDRDSMSNSPVSTVSNPRSSCGKEDMYTKPYGFTETGQSHNSFKNDQPCCCSRKEVALNYHDSYMLRKLPTESQDNSTVSPSKPVLRLMGKNLTVVKTDEDEFRPPQTTQRPMIFGQYQNGVESQPFNIHPSRSHDHFGSVHRGFTPPMDCYGNVVGFQSVSGRNGCNSAKEIAILDDSHKNEDNDDTMQNRFLKENQMSLSYTTYPSYVGSVGGSTVFRGGGFRTSIDNGNHAAKWNIGSSTTYHPPSYP